MRAVTHNCETPKNLLEAIDGGKTDGIAGDESSGGSDCSYEISCSLPPRQCGRGCGTSNDEVTEKVTYEMIKNNCGLA